MSHEGKPKKYQIKILEKKLEAAQRRNSSYFKQIVMLERLLDQANENLAAYQKWFRDHEYIISERPSNPQPEEENEVAE